MVVVVVADRVVVDVVEEVIDGDGFESLLTVFGLDTCSWPANGAFPVVHGD